MNRLGNERDIVETENRVDADAVAQMRALVHIPGTVVFPKIGGALATNKRRVLVQPTIIDNNCLGITPNEGILTDWLFILLSSIDMAELANDGPVPAVSQKALERIVVGLPPTGEQTRTVERVDELNRLCDELEQQLLGERELAADLAESAVSSLVARVA